MARSRHLPRRQELLSLDWGLAARLREGVQVDLVPPLAMMVSRNVPLDRNEAQLTSMARSRTLVSIRAIVFTLILAAKDAGTWDTSKVLNPAFCVNAKTSASE